MKLSSYHYKLILQYLFLTLLCIPIISSQSEEATLNYTYINYTESTIGTIFPNSPPQVVNVRGYDDGTIIVSIARQNDSTMLINQAKTIPYNCVGQSLEQVLRLRAIQLDGTIKEINPRLNLDPVNYCIFNDSHGNPVNPITIFPLYQPFILINYVKAPNITNPITYEEWGNVIDLSGNNI
ncbi:4070_t:CDS:1, partial [Cetraspora pellucida]